MKMNFKKKNIILITVFLLFLVGGGISLLKFNQNKMPKSLLIPPNASHATPNYELDFPEKFEKYKNDPTYIKCREINDNGESCLIMAVSEKIKTVEDLVLCEDVAIPEDVTVCKSMEATKLSVESGDLSLCEELTDSEFKYNCKFSTVIHKVRNEKTLDGCDIFDDTEEKQSCINVGAAYIARKKSDISWCDKITGGIGPDGEIDYAKSLCIYDVENPVIW